MIVLKYRGILSLDCKLVCIWMTIIDSQFYIIDSLSLDVSLEWNAKLVVAWLYVLHISWIYIYVAYISTQNVPTWLKNVDLVVKHQIIQLKQNTWTVFLFCRILTHWSRVDFRLINCISPFLFKGLWSGTFHFYSNDIQGVKINFWKRMQYARET